MRQKESRLFLVSLDSFVFLCCAAPVFFSLGSYQCSTILVWDAFSSVLVYVPVECLQVYLSMLEGCDGLV